MEAEAAASFDLAGHWIFPAFFGVMTVVIGIIFVKSVFLSNNDSDNEKDEDK